MYRIAVTISNSEITFSQMSQPQRTTPGPNLPRQAGHLFCYNSSLCMVQPDPLTLRLTSHYAKGLLMGGVHHKVCMGISIINKCMGTKDFKTRLRFKLLIWQFGNTRYYLLDTEYVDINPIILIPLLYWITILLLYRILILLLFKGY